MIWVAAWGGQCWGHVPLFMSAGVSWPPCSLIPITSCPAQVTWMTSDDHLAFHILFLAMPVHGVPWEWRAAWGQGVGVGVRAIGEVLVATGPQALRMCF